jgi:hypothetical protein
VSVIRHEYRLVGFDSNLLPFFLDANRGEYQPHVGDSVGEQQIAAFRLFLYCKPVIVPAVTPEAEAIRDAAKRDEHLRFVSINFIEFLPDEYQEHAIDRRVTELLPLHVRGKKDCRILAEVEAHFALGGTPVLVTFDSRFRKELAPHTKIDPSGVSDGLLGVI